MNLDNDMVKRWIKIIGNFWLAAYILVGSVLGLLYFAEYIGSPLHQWITGLKGDHMLLNSLLDFDNRMSYVVINSAFPLFYVWGIFSLLYSTGKVSRAHLNELGYFFAPITSSFSSFFFLFIAFLLSGIIYALWREGISLSGVVLLAAILFLTYVAYAMKKVSTFNINEKAEERLARIGGVPSLGLIAFAVIMHIVAIFGPVIDDAIDIYRAFEAR